MERSLRGSRAGLVAAGLLAVGAIVEIARIVAHAPWPGLGVVHSPLIGALLAALWIVAAAGLVLHARSWRIAGVGWVAGWASVVTMLGHGLVTTWGGGLQVPSSKLGLLFVPGAVALAVLVRRTFLRGFLGPAPRQHARRALSPTLAR
jgi:hypothetical protein